MTYGNSQVISTSDTPHVCRGAYLGTGSDPADYTSARFLPLVPRDLGVSCSVYGIHSSRNAALPSPRRRAVHL